MIRVVNKYHTAGGVSVMRPSPLGNPYSHQAGTTAQFRVATREEAVENYRTWLFRQIQEGNKLVVDELVRLLELARQGDLELRCCCAPKSCHADVVKECLEAQLERLRGESRAVFVFGSNTQGRHGAGAALMAHRKCGAVLGVPRGHHGDSYALPTCGDWDPISRRFPPLPLEAVADEVLEFMRYAASRPDLRFQVTRVGCGLAGFKDSEIALMFQAAPSNCQFDEKWAYWLPGKAFWGTF